MVREVIFNVMVNSFSEPEQNLNIGCLPDYPPMIQTKKAFCSVGIVFYSIILTNPFFVNTNVVDVLNQTLIFFLSGSAATKEFPIIKRITEVTEAAITVDVSCRRT
jgi:hypothetical protein